jgi:hypothetical protein
LAQIEQRIGSRHLKKLLGREAKSDVKKGRIQVSAPEERTIDGHVFASRMEAEAYREIRDILGVEAFHLQPEFLLQEKFTDSEGNKHRAIMYRADFLIGGPPREGPDTPVLPGQMVVDVKGHKTELFRLKQKLFLARYRTPLYLPSSKTQLRELLNRVKR